MIPRFKLAQMKKSISKTENSDGFIWDLECLSCKTNKTGVVFFGGQVFLYFILRLKKTTCGWRIREGARSWWLSLLVAEGSI